MIYLDYNATTPLCDDARRAMEPFLAEDFGNPSSIHAAGRTARAAVDEARDRLAVLLAVKSQEIVFTSGGTEANNLAVLGLARGARTHGRHLISAKSEHHAVLNAVEHLERDFGFEVSWLKMDRNGIVDLDHLRTSLRDDTTLVSIMHANNETGIIQPLSEISALCRARHVPFHSDMVQSFGKIGIDLGLVDAASFAAHKFYGPKGAGFVVVRSGLSLAPMGFGGAHENQRRPGTENVAAIAGMAAAATAAALDRDQKRQGELRDRLWQTLSTGTVEVRLNHDLGLSLANTLNVSFPALDSETMLMALDLEGVCASSGSACMVGSVVASHVLLAQGASPERARSAVRFSLGKFTTAEDVRRTAEIVQEIMLRNCTSRKIARG